MKRGPDLLRMPATDPALTQAARLLRILAAFGCGILITAYVLFARTSLGQFWGDSAYLGRLAESKILRRFDRRLLESIDIRVFLIGALALVIVGMFRHQLKVGLAVAATYLGSLASAEMLKWALTRPILATDAEALMDVKAGLNTFPSGHATFVTALALGMVFLAPARLRAGVALGAMVAVTAVAGGIVTAGWHRPSDAIGGISLALIWLSLGSAFLIKRLGMPVQRGNWVHRVALSGTAIALVFTVVFAALVAHPELSGAAALVAMNAVIFASAIGAIALFARAIAGVDLQCR